MRGEDNPRVHDEWRNKPKSHRRNRAGFIEYRFLPVVIVGLICGGPAVSNTAAQSGAGPDVRGINPLMMLVVDTSGSMEYKTECECTSNSCVNCYPGCEKGPPYVKNRWAITLEALTGGWANGFSCQTFPRSNSAAFDYDFGYPIPYHQPWRCSEGTDPCNTAAERPQNEDGILDTYRSRVQFGMMTFDSMETYLGAGSSMVNEAEFDNGLSQSAAGLFSFGPGEDILTFADDEPVSDASGNWLYLTNSDRYRGANAPDRFVGHLNFPTCATPFRIDTGIRRAPATGEVIVGGLISPLEQDTELETVNTRIQESLLGARPYLGTPIAASLDDLYFYLRGDTEITGEPLFACRGRYALLITDGEPDDDFRQISNCDCESAEDCCLAATGSPSCTDESDPDFRAKYDPDAKGYQCPYPKAEEVAEALLCGYDSASCAAGVIEQLFVVGFALPDCQRIDGEYVCDSGSKGEEIYNRLQAIAEAGSPDGEGKALFAENLEELRATLAEVLDNIASEPVSRTTPTFASSSQGTGVDQVQYQFSTGFVVGSVEKGVPWSGILERKRIEAADTTLGYVEHDLESQDRFHEVLNNRNSPRKLYSVFPKPGSECTGENDIDPTSTQCTLRDHLFRGSQSAPCGDIDCTPGSTCYCEIDEESACGPNPTNPANDDCAFTATQLGASDDARRVQLVKWLHAIADSGDPDFLQRRATERLGDIYFSSPAVMGRPVFERGDESYNEFRQSSIVANRPLVVFVGSNDGILHAFSVEEFPGGGVSLPAPYNTTSYTTGEEMWGFIPPILAQHVNAAADAHMPMVNGSPVVKDVFLSRRAGLGLCLDPDKSPETLDAGGLCNYRTILITGLRDGERAYIALDVTNPTKPQFLWQFTHPKMGHSYGRPGVGQVTIEWPVGASDARIMERAVAILPGGANKGGLLSGQCSSFRHTSGQNSVYHTLSAPDDATRHYHREYVRCWSEIGRSVFIVDIKTGILIKQIDESVFPSPVVGSPSLFHGEIGTIATRAFVGDADGVIWRIDLSDIDPHNDDSETDWQLKGWTARPFHDMFWAHSSGNGYPNGYQEGQPGYEPPVLSVDEKGRVVVIYGTGDVDDFEDETARNYVVSLTETNVFEQTAYDPEAVEAAFNWEIARESTSGGSSYGMKASELVTGPIDLYDRKIFFASFVAISDVNDACAWGQSHLFAVDYIKRDNERQNPLHSPTTYYPLELSPEQLGSDAENFNRYHDDKLYMGVAVVKRPQFHTVETQSNDPYIEMGALVETTETSPPVFELVSMASGGEREGGSELGTSASRIAPPESASRTLSLSTSCE